MNKKALILMVVLFFLLNVSYIVAENLNMKEGLWKITVTMKIPEMTMQMPAHTFTHCLTKTDYIPLKEEPNEDCKIIKHDVVDNTVIWVIKCRAPEGDVINSGKVTYNGNTFNGIIKIEQEGMKITQKIKGKWIGKCK